MYNRLLQILNVIHDLQSSSEGITYAEIQKRLNVSRRTAERIIKAINESFLEIEQATKRPKRWRMKSSFFVPSFKSEHLAVLETASQMYHDKGMSSYAQTMDDVSILLRAGLGTRALTQLDSDVELLTESEGFVFRPGPKETITPETLKKLRYAVLACKAVKFSYLYRYGNRKRPVTVYPYGFLHGTREYLVAFNPSRSRNDFRTYIVSRISNLRVLEDDYFVRDESFTFNSFLSDCFGAYHDKPYKVVWRFDATVAKEASEWQFHHTQETKELEDGRLEVSFRACGLEEMAHHLVTWGKLVEVVKPKILRKKLLQLVKDIQQVY